MTTLAQPTDDKNVLLQMEQSWNNALKSKDVSWFEQNLADDLTDTSSGSGALHTKSDDVAALKQDKTVYESMELSNLQVRIEGNAGIVTGVIGKESMFSCRKVRLGWSCPRNNPVDAYTMAAIVRDAGLTIDQFKELL